ncbi:MAG: histidine--tRNA ligase [Chloroflexi bacterium]|nr:histidine--tRNA ligase [Chloroflexota bacterium]
MYQAPRGTADILPEDQPLWSFTAATVTQAAHVHGYRRIDTPIFEETGLFLRTVGEETDIVQKEMYSFDDRGGTNITLRPEGTAAVCRAYLESGMHNQAQPVRLFYLCPMFRYDRPQAGRFRQFHQFGVEAIGDTNAAVDLEVIQLAMDTMRRLGLGGMKLLLNNIGDAVDRPRFMDALQEHFRPHIAHLGKDDRRRFDTSPLRLLDSKELARESFMNDAPKSTDFLGDEAQAHWDELLAYLDDLKIPYVLDSKLVRGLDYYTRTVFEVHPDREGSQSAVCAGGRYDGLIEQLGGKPTPGIGFAAGIERLILNLREQGATAGIVPPAPIVIAYSGAEAKTKAVVIATELRAADVTAVLAPERSMKAQMRYASSVGARKVVILGPKELEAGVATVRDMETAEQKEEPQGGLLESLSN